MSFGKFFKYAVALLAIAFILPESTLKSHHGPASFTVFPKSGNTEAGADSSPLPAPGESATRELSRDEAHSYQVTLEANEFVHVVVEQEGMEANVTLIDSQGRKLVQLACRHYGPTPVSFIAATPGVYRMEVRSLEREQKNGRYKLSAAEPRPATSRDYDRITAEKAFAEAEQLLTEWKATSSRRAIDRFKDSLPLWRAAGDLRQEALALKRIGDVYQPLGEFQGALSFYNQALSLARAIKDRRSEGETLNEMGYVYLILGKNQQARRLGSQALRFSQSTGDAREIARAHNSLGEIHYGLGDLRQSLRYFEEALRLWQKVDDRHGQALTLLNSGYTYSDQGQVREAFNRYQQAISMWQAIGDRRGHAITLTAIGRLYSRIGESQEALNFFERAMQLIQPIGDPIWEASALNGMAYVYNGLGESPRALECYNRSLLLLRAANYRSGEAATLGEMGRVYLSLGDNRKALEHHEQALSIFRAVGDRRMEIVELKEIGKVYDAQGEKGKALEYYQRARSSYRAGKDLRGEAVTLNLIGQIYAGWGQQQKALDSYKTSLPLCRKAEYPFGEAAALHNIARLERDSGNLTAARERAEAALSIVESLRAKVISQDLRSSFFASVRQHHELYVDLLMRLHKEHPSEGFNKAAFEASERARARSLLDTLALARVGVRDKADPALLERESKLNKEFNEKASRRRNLARGDESASAEQAALAKQIDELVWQLREVESQIRATSIEHAPLLPTQPVGLNGIQQQLLDEDSLLLEYMLGEERSYLWAVTRTEITSYELPGRAEIEGKASKFYELLKANQPIPGEAIEERQRRIAEANTSLAAASESLSKLVIGPVFDKLGTKRLIIVPDGALQYIPFQALTVPATMNTPAKTAGSANEQIPLLVDHEIVYEPSASALALVLTASSRRKPAQNSVAVFADPVFEADDSRVKSTTGVAPETGNSSKTKVQEAFRDVGLDSERIPTLPASREEADSIIALAPWGTGSKAIGFDASRDTVMKPELAHYRIVHFATHGFVDYQHPELSGLVLSLVDQKGQPQDGFLRLHDIYNLKLSANLVVLSACNTGLGKEIKGEGMIGLTRGFMYAGATGVAASLWKVDDDATAELMKGFYEGIFKKGLTPAAALRESQLAMRQQKRWSAPYYWAAFVIQGQYDQKEEITSARKPELAWLALWSGLASTALIGAFHLIRRRSRIL